MAIVRWRPSARAPTPWRTLIAGEAVSGDLVVFLGAGDLTAWAQRPAPRNWRRWPLELAADRPKAVARGKILRDEPLAPFTWLRVGGPAEALFLPADEDDLVAVS